MAKERRFIISEKEGMMEGAKIITDSEMGVQYLYAFEGYAGGLTILVEKKETVIGQESQPHDSCPPSVRRVSTRHYEPNWFFNLNQ